MIFEHIAPYITPIIWFFAIADFVILIWAYFQIGKLKKLVHPLKHYEFHNDISVDGNKLVDASDFAAFLYTLYANITAIFPLLGIFGTVCSLLNSSPGSDASNNFFIALDTTVWGLIFAMIFKLADSAISSKLDRALDEADYQIHKLTQEVGKTYAQTETGYRH